MKIKLSKLLLLKGSAAARTAKIGIVEPPAPTKSADLKFLGNAKAAFPHQ